MLLMHSPKLQNSYYLKSLFIINRQTNGLSEIEEKE